MPKAATEVSAQTSNGFSVLADWEFPKNAADLSTRGGEKPPSRPIFPGPADQNRQPRRLTHATRSEIGGPADLSTTRGAKSASPPIFPRHAERNRRARRFFHDTRSEIGEP